MTGTAPRLVGEVARDLGIALHELKGIQKTLEDVYVGITGAEYFKQ